MADGAVAGQIFAAPNPESILATIEALKVEAGVILLYGNYSGDVLNFGFAAEEAQQKGMQVAEIRVHDDIASAPVSKQSERRGIAGDIFVLRCTAAAADRGDSFAEVLRLGEKANHHTRSLGVALAAASSIDTGKSMFELPFGQLEIGMGLQMTWRTIVNCESLDLTSARELLIATLLELATHREQLNLLDQALGDGDHGNTIARGCEASISSLKSANFGSVNQVFGIIGRSMMSSMGGASGMLFGLLFRAAESCPSVTRLDSSTLATIFRQGLDSLQARTKTKVGDKTMLDALVPAVVALEENQHGPLPEALDKASNAARIGAQSTAGMLPRVGRAKTLGERARDGQDPGANSICFLFAGLAAKVKRLIPGNN
jgi:phosphoenolpyruvate---glycerone phosphotransferase subunit DhaL